MKKIIMLAVTLLCTTSVSATVLFSESFETDLSLWVGKDGGSHQGAIVSDPLQSDNALTFTGLNSGGDIFTSSTFFSSSTGNYTLSYDYLGTCSTNDCGGFVGFSYGLPGSHVWLAGTSTVSGAADINIDDGVWNRVEISFNAGMSPIRLMFEDFAGSGGIAGDVFFDNIKLTDGMIDVPEPSVLALLTMGMLALGFRAVAR